MARQDRHRSGAGRRPGRRPAPATLAPGGHGALRDAQCRSGGDGPLPRLRTGAESAAEAGLCDRRFVADGFGPWALEHAGRFIGFAGAMRIIRPLPFPGGDRPGSTVELAWRLAQASWGRGLATRAARLALADLAERCGIRAVVAYTAAGNLRSRAVMGRLGMVAAGTFPHPAVPEGPLCEHVLYRLDGVDREAAA
ncbi:GNAT family N-acetyltransferase [Methylobacterium phyllosphaerae]